MDLFLVDLRITNFGGHIAGQYIVCFPLALDSFVDYSIFGQQIVFF
jgi:hypothetical protein